MDKVMENYMQAGAVGLGFRVHLKGIDKRLKRHGKETDATVAWVGEQKPEFIWLLG